MLPILFFIQHAISLVGVLIILTGAVKALYEYMRFLLRPALDPTLTINTIRLHLGRTLILGLEFIVAADLIGTTSTPDYYSLGILGAIVLIRTVLNFTLNRELIALSKET